MAVIPASIQCLLQHTTPLASSF
uniref:Uncharacterized protein n=1 Tax=Anguilla anguilla TaxID=7936 RepID=A0A0E9T4I6_ANGAN